MPHQELKNEALIGGSGLNAGLGVDARHRHEIIADLVSARKRIYDLEHEIVLLRQGDTMMKQILSGLIDRGGIPNWILDLSPNVK